jgi:NADH-quinone oxidoreductase subunit L
MGRLMAMTFHGENRTGEAERPHLHEAPAVMTGPLIVLALLSLVGGAINLPHFVEAPRLSSAGSSPSLTLPSPCIRS